MKRVGILDANSRANWLLELLGQYSVNVVPVGEERLPLELANFDAVISVNHWLDFAAVRVSDVARANGLHLITVVIDAACAYVGNFTWETELSACFQCWLLRCAQLGYVGPSEVGVWNRGGAELVFSGSSPLGSNVQTAVGECVARNLFGSIDVSVLDGDFTVFERLSLTDGIYDRVSVVPVSGCECRIG